MRRSIASVSDLAELLNDTLKCRATDTMHAGRYMVNKVSQMSIFMQTSRGRDKICCLIQYTADLYDQCIKNSNIEMIQQLYLQKNYQRKLNSKKVASRIRESMKNGRKIFKFLRFLDSIRGLVKVMDMHKPLYFKVIMFITYTCNFFYYILDHIIWGINLGVINEYVPSQTKATVKSIKDSFSMAKALLKILRAYFNYRLIHQKEQHLAEEIYNLPNNTISEEGLVIQSCKSLLKSRAKRREKQINFIITILRITMLWKRLRLVGHHNISKIFYASSGLIITCLHIILQLSQKNNLLMLKPTNKDKSLQNQNDKHLIKSNSVTFAPNYIRRIQADLDNILNDDSDNEHDE